VSFLKRKKTAREISKDITEGKKEPEHLGKMSIEVIDQLIFSLGNTNPMFRNSKWNKSYENVKDAIMKRLSKNENSIICQVQLNSLELVGNQR